MRERIIQLRKQLGLNQEKFAKSIGVSRNFINLYENGNRDISDRTILDICRIHNANEQWIRTGEGEMIVPLTREQEIAKITASMFNEEEAPIRSKLHMLLEEMSEHDIETFVKCAGMIYKAAMSETKEE